MDVRFVAQRAALTAACLLLPALWLAMMFARAPLSAAAEGSGAAPPITPIHDEKTSGQRSFSIGDYVWYDADGDGLPNEPPLSAGINDVSLTLIADRDCDGLISLGDVVLAEARTGPAPVTEYPGHYSFDIDYLGCYLIDVDESSLPPNYIRTTASEPFPYIADTYDDFANADFGYREDLLPTPTETATATATASPTVTTTPAPEPTRTPTSTVSPSPSPAPTFTFTVAPTATLTASPSPLPSATASPTSTSPPLPTMTPTLSPTRSATTTQTRTPTRTFTPSASPTDAPPTLSPTASPTTTPSLTPSPGATATLTRTPTRTFTPMTATATPDLTATPTRTATPAPPTPTSDPAETATVPPTASPGGPDTATPTFTPTWAFPGTRTPTLSPTPTAWLPPSPTAAATAPPQTPTPASTVPTPEPSPTLPSDTLRFQLTMPAQHFATGQTCALEGLIVNSGDPVDAAMVVFLDLGSGDYWFYPSWSHYPPSIDYEPLYVDAGQRNITLIPPFAWPAETGELSGLAFAGALLNPSVTVLLTPVTRWHFSYGP